MDRDAVDGVLGTFALLEAPPLNPLEVVVLVLVFGVEEVLGTVVLLLAPPLNPLEDVLGLVVEVLEVGLLVFTLLLLPPLNPELAANTPVGNNKARITTNAISLLYIASSSLLVDRLN